MPCHKKFTFLRPAAHPPCTRLRAPGGIAPGRRCRQGSSTRRYSGVYPTHAPLGSSSSSNTSTSRPTNPSRYRRPTASPRAISSRARCSFCALDELAGHGRCLGLLPCANRGTHGFFANPTASIMWRVWAYSSSVSPGKPVRMSRGKGCLRKFPAKVLHTGQVHFRIIPPSHTGQPGIRTALQGQVRTAGTPCPAPSAGMQTMAWRW